jgi:GAF domain-containing protein
MRGARMPRITDEVTISAAADLRELGDHLVDRLASRVNFQRFNIGLIDAAEHVFIDAYVSGQNVAGRATGHRRTLDGTVVERAIDAGDGVFVGGDPESLLRDFPRFGPVLESGMRAMLAAPLRHDGVVIASLVLASEKPDAFNRDILDLVNLAGAEVVSRIAELRGIA